MRVLLVKLSSMGDLIHTLPALTDAAAAIPGIKFTWLVDAEFAEIAHWHPAVDMVVPIELRERNIKQVTSTIRRLRIKKYDLIIDAQGLLKSALLARLARGKTRVGYAKNACREPIASYFYNRKFNISLELHAVERMRQLFAASLNYKSPQTAPDYGINWNEIVESQAPEQDYVAPYLLFLHGTTWDSKHWPEEYWLQLAGLVSRHNLAVQLTWATEEQKQRALRLSAYAKNIIMLPHLTINDFVRVLYYAKGAVAVDTGFAHLAAAMSKPTVAIYGSTSAVKSGAVGTNAVNISSKFECAPCFKRTCNLEPTDRIFPPCYKEITPEVVWQIIAPMLQRYYNT